MVCLALWHEQDVIEDRWEAAAAVEWTGTRATAEPSAASTYTVQVNCLLSSKGHSLLAKSVFKHIRE